MFDLDWEMHSLVLMVFIGLKTGKSKIHLWIEHVQTSSCSWVTGQLLESPMSQQFIGGQIYEFTKRNFHYFFFSLFSFFFCSLVQTGGDDFSHILADGISHE